MKINILSFSIIGFKRELKKALEQYKKEAANRKSVKWEVEDANKLNCEFDIYLGVGLIPSNDFSYYD